MGSKAPSRVRIPHSPPFVAHDSAAQDSIAQQSDPQRGVTSTASGSVHRISNASNSAQGLTKPIRIGTIPLLHHLQHAPVAQLDRAPGYELGGREFESLRAHHIPKKPASIAGFFIARVYCPHDAQRSSSAGKSRQGHRDFHDARSSGQEHFDPQAQPHRGDSDAGDGINPASLLREFALMPRLNRGTGASPAPRIARLPPAALRECLRPRSGRGPSPRCGRP